MSSEAGSKRFACGFVSTKSSPAIIADYDARTAVEPELVLRLASLL
jgi:hypothetical protein